jgi:hypothetical protein
VCHRTRTDGAFGLTGNVIILAMFFIYCGAHERVKRAHYETFWNSHHCFIIFFVALFFHGSVFWQWALVTVLPYAVGPRPTAHTRDSSYTRQRA